MGQARSVAARPLRGRDRASRAVKSVVAWAALRSGLLAVYRRRLGGDVILLYHRVVTEPGELLDYSPYGVSVSVEAFAAQMRFLADHYDVVPLEALSRPGHGVRPRCAITFDDGWRDNLTAAWPILKPHAFPVTIFLGTNLMAGGPWFWEERLMALVARCYQMHASGRTVDARLLGLSEIEAVLARPEAEVPAAVAALVGRLRDATERRETVLAVLDEAAQQPGFRSSPWFLTWDEVKALAAAGVAFGGHTASHVNLTGCSREVAVEEIHSCGRALDHHLGPERRAFAYPYGKHNADVCAAVAAAGFTLGCTTVRQTVQSVDDLYRLPRIDVYQDVAESVPLFACRIACFLNAY